MAARRSRSPPRNRATDSNPIPDATAATPSQQQCAEEADWKMTLEYQNKYGYRRYSIESAQLEVKVDDGTYVPFKVRPGERGDDTDIRIVANDRIVAAAEKNRRVRDGASVRPCEILVWAERERRGNRRAVQVFHQAGRTVFYKAQSSCRSGDHRGIQGVGWRRLVGAQ